MTRSRSFAHQPLLCGSSHSFSHLVLAMWKPKIGPLHAKSSARDSLKSRLIPFIQVGKKGEEGIKCQCSCL
jgi:hypothetical protein